ncbi:MAG: lasso peptide biosynthesis protein [Rikenellaceae bacterium]|nr:lasso peptide biosynthesis protein [Rikenellaceae bacterium]
MNNIEILCQSSQLIEGIIDVDVKPVAGQPLVVAYQTGQRKTLLIDFGNPKLDAYAQKAFELARKHAPMPEGLDMQKIQEWGALYVYLLNAYVGRMPVADAAMDTRWGQAWSNSSCELGEMMATTQAAKCRERSIMLHILLAEFGIPSRVMLSPGHAWVVCDDKDKKPVLGLDPAHSVVLRTAAGEDPLQGNAPTTCEWFTVAKPIKLKPFLGFPDFDWITPVPAGWL